jgi:hypothetical protein
VRNRIAIGAALAALGLGAHATGFEIKGLAPATTMDEMHAEYPKLGCSPPDGGWFETCSYSPNPYGNYSEQFPHIEELDTIGGARVSNLSINFGPGSRVAEIDVATSPVWYGDLLAGLVGKFGKPASSRTITYRNGFGVRFTGRQATWIRAGQRMELTEYAGSTDLMVLVLWDQKLLAGLNANKAAFARKKAKGDL